MIKETSGECYEEARALNQNLSFLSTEIFFLKEIYEYIGEEF